MTKHIDGKAFSLLEGFLIFNMDYTLPDKVIPCLNIKSLSPQK